MPQQGHVVTVCAGEPEGMSLACHLQTCLGFFWGPERLQVMSLALRIASKAFGRLGKDTSGCTEVLFYGLPVF